MPSLDVEKRPARLVLDSNTRQSKHVQTKCLRKCPFMLDLYLAVLPCGIERERRDCDAEILASRPPAEVLYELILSKCEESLDIV